MPPWPSTSTSTDSPVVRERAAQRLGYLGVDIDPTANENVTEDVDIATVSAAVRTVVITAREDIQIAGEARGLMTGK